MRRSFKFALGALLASGLFFSIPSQAFHEIDVISCSANHICCQFNNQTGKITRCWVEPH